MEHFIRSTIIQDMNTSVINVASGKGFLQKKNHVSNQYHDFSVHRVDRD